MSKSRFHHLSTCLMCVVVCFFLQMHYASFGWQYWLLMGVAIYAMQPINNTSWHVMVRLWPKRKGRDPYELVGK